MLSIIQVKKRPTDLKKTVGETDYPYIPTVRLGKSLSLVADYRRRDVIEVMADTSMSICEGERRQMRSCYDVRQGLKRYLRRIEENGY